MGFLCLRQWAEGIVFRLQQQQQQPARAQEPAAEDKDTQMDEEGGEAEEDAASSIDWDEVAQRDAAAEEVRTRMEAAQERLEARRNRGMLPPPARCPDCGAVPACRNVAGYSLAGCVSPVPSDHLAVHTKTFERQVRNEDTVFAQSVEEVSGMYTTVP